MDPQLSVVIAAHDAAAVIGESLALLCARTSAELTEIIVADSSTDDTPKLVEKFPRVRLLHFDQPLPIHDLRGRGIALARAPVIAILDPFSLVSAGWEGALLDAHRRRPEPVVGGAVDFADAENQTLLRWAAYLDEYGLFMPPVEAGPVALLPGCNLSYKRAALFDGAQPRFPVFWKTFVNADVSSRGAPLWLEPGVAVSLSKPVPFADYFASRFEHGRCFAGMRSQGWGWPRRLLYAAGSALLPLVLFWRRGPAFWKKGTWRARFVAALPWLGLLSGMWAAGEAWGYLFGSGRSCQRLFY